MKELLICAAVFSVYFGAPLISTLWWLHCLNSYRCAVPFTEEKDRKKISLIISSVIAGILDTIFVVFLMYYAFTYFFVF